MNLADLKVDTLFLCNTVQAQYKDEALERNINHYYDEAVMEIWKAEGTWKFDEGVETLPVGKTNLVKGQEDYQLPSTARKIERVEVKWNGNWTRLEPVTAEDIDTLSDSESLGEPKRYYLKGRSVYIRPIPKSDVEGGLRIFISRSPSKLEAGDTPKIDKEFHRYLSIGATMDWHIANGNIRKSREMENRLEKMKQSMRNFYSNRNEDYKSSLTAKKENYK